ncbi:protein Star-like isoform X1 [Ruditapes philippinarum]|uniref:protein Star-like isoform X1 n=1 Tax=Ruditapes philippinarum TaxID=129788 RepID=UPI00295ACC69|nr:protein Star-like isoform X1 [Ruditapes philippinarum]
MRLYTVSYVASTSVLIYLVYFIYKNQSLQFFDKRFSHRNTPDDKTEVVWQGVFPHDRTHVVHAENIKPLTLSIKRNSSFDYKAAMTKLNEARVRQDDPRLIKLIRDYYIEPPSKTPYNLTNPEQLEFSNGQTPFVDSRLNYMEGGFYIECGALTGEKGSNTLFLEKVRKWNGLLIEADPENFKVLKTKNRKAFTMHACLNTKPYPAVMTFNKAFNRGRVVHNQEAKNWIKRHNITKDEVLVQCFPLYSILLALGQVNVDFLSLDVEGDELNVLKTIPWDKVYMKMLTVEYVHEIGSSGELKKYVEKQGYDSLLQVSKGGGGVNDIIFRKKGLTHKYII